MAGSPGSVAQSLWWISEYAIQVASFRCRVQFQPRPLQSGHFFHEFQNVWWSFPFPQQRGQARQLMRSLFRGRCRRCRFRRFRFRHTGGIRRVPRCVWSLVSLVFLVSAPVGGLVPFVDVQQGFPVAHLRHEPRPIRRSCGTRWRAGRRVRCRRRCRRRARWDTDRAAWSFPPFG